MGWLTAMVPKSKDARSFMLRRATMHYAMCVDRRWGWTVRMIRPGNERYEMRSNEAMIDDRWGWHWSMDGDKVRRGDNQQSARVMMDDRRWTIGRMTMDHGKWWTMDDRRWTTRATITMDIWGDNERGDKMVRLQRRTWWPVKKLDSSPFK